MNDEKENTVNTASPRSSLASSCGSSARELVDDDASVNCESNSSFMNDEKEHRRSGADVSAATERTLSSVASSTGFSQRDLGDDGATFVSADPGPLPMETQESEEAMIESELFADDDDGMSDSTGDSRFEGESRVTIASAETAPISSHSTDPNDSALIHRIHIDERNANDNLVGNYDAGANGNGSAISSPHDTSHSNDDGNSFNPSANIGANASTNAGLPSFSELNFPIMEVQGSLAPIIGDNNVIHVHSPNDVSRIHNFNPEGHLIYLPSNLPAVSETLSRNLQFTRSEEVICILHKVSKSPITLICGPRGIGKTQTALRVARCLNYDAAFHLNILGDTDVEQIASKLHMTVYGEMVKECPLQRFIASLKGTGAILIVLDVSNSFFNDSGLRAFLQDLTGCQNLKIVLTTLTVPRCTPDNCEYVELKPLSTKHSRDMVVEKGCNICENIECASITCKENGCKVVHVAQGIPLYLNMLSESVLRGEEIPEIMSSDDFEELHSWIFKQLSADDIRVVTSASIFDDAFDSTIVFEIMKSDHVGIERDVLRKSIATLKDRFVLSSFQNVENGKCYKMHPCFRLYLSESKTYGPGVKRAFHSFILTFLKRLIEVSLKSWHKNSLSDAVLEFKKNMSHFDQLLNYFAETTKDDWKTIGSVLVKVFKGREWVLYKTFFFLECCLSFKRVGCFAEAIYKICETLEPITNIDILNLLVISLSYYNDNGRRQCRSEIESINRAKDLLYAVAPVKDGKKNLLDTHPCPDYVRWYYFYVSGRSFATSKKKNQVAIKAFGQAISMTKKFQTEDSEEKRHRDVDLFEYEMCRLKSRYSEENCDLYAVYKEYISTVDNIRDILGDHELTSTALKRVGDFCLEKKKDYSEAINYYTDAMEMMERLRGGDPQDNDYNANIVEWPQTIMIMKNLACAQCYHDWELEEWQITLKKAEFLMKKYFPSEDHFWCLKLYNDSADLHLFLAEKGKGSYETPLKFAKDGIAVCVKLQAQNRAQNAYRRKHLEEIIEICEKKCELMQQNVTVADGMESR